MFGLASAPILGRFRRAIRSVVPALPAVSPGTDPLAPPTRDRTGTEIAGGRYRVLGRIGGGRMGQVYRAYDGHLKADVVIKFPIEPDGSPEAAEYRERFARESRSLVRLSHPHIVKAIDVGEDRGQPYVVMPYLDGGSLKDHLVTGPDGEPRPSPPESLHGWLPDIARALDFLHDQGSIHRDVKPANILFDRHGNAFLGDFGVIKVAGSDEVEPGTPAAPSYLLGTPNYLAPELVLGRPCDDRVDQYALALTVHETLTGWNFMEGPTNLSTMVNQAKLEPPALDRLLVGLPRRLSMAVLRGLSKDPGDRFESCSALASEALADVPPPVPGRTPPPTVLIAPASTGEPGRVPCPACGGLLPVVRKHDGRRISCTRCHAIAVVHLTAEAVRLRLFAPPPVPPDPAP